MQNIIDSIKKKWNEYLFKKFKKNIVIAHSEMVISETELVMMKDPKDYMEHVKNVLVKEMARNLVENNLVEFTEKETYNLFARRTRATVYIYKK